MNTRVWAIGCLAAGLTLQCDDKSLLKPDIILPV
jgi:hypothetical protein